VLDLAGEDLVADDDDAGGAIPGRHAHTEIASFRKSLVPIRTLTTAGLPAPSARSSAGRSSAGASTHSPWPPSASIMRSYRLAASLHAGVRSGPYTCCWPRRICVQAASLPMTPTMLIFCRTQDSNSIMLSPNAPSPYMMITSLFGEASLAAIA